MQLRIVVGSLIILCSMMAAAVTAYFNSQESYYTVAELFADPALASGSGGEAIAVTDSTLELASLPGRRVQLHGAIDYDSVNRPDEGLSLAFDLVGGGGRVHVTYEGIVPDTFEQAESVTVGGQFDEQGVFRADQLFVQCPSKYEVEPPGVSAPANG